MIIWVVDVFEQEMCCDGFLLWISQFGISTQLIVIPKSDSEGGRKRDLTMRSHHHGRKLG